MALTSSISVSANADLQSSLGLVTADIPLIVRAATQMAAGTGAGQADKVFHGRRTLAASAAEDLDLAGVLLDGFGAVVTFARIKGLYIAASPSNTNNVVVGNAASNGWATLLSATGTLTLRPGAFIGLGTGAADAVCYGVTPATGDLLHVANSGAGTPVTYDVVIIGSSV